MMFTKSRFYCISPILSVLKVLSSSVYMHFVKQLIQIRYYIMQYIISKVSIRFTRQEYFKCTNFDSKCHYYKKKVMEIGTSNNAIDLDG